MAIVSAVVSILLLAGGIVLWKQVQTEIVTLHKSIKQKDVMITDYGQIITDQKKQIEGNQAFIRVLRKQVTSPIANFAYMKSLIENASKTVTDIKKLEEADKQLLAKYSKVYFLNEHYVPTGLVSIPSAFLSYNKNLQIKKLVLPFLEDMFKAMEKDKLKPRVISSYRSFNFQENLKNRDVITYGVGTANKFVADQGYSEHQLGTTVDIGTSIPNQDFSKFKSTKEYAWLLKNAYRYGFVLSYPDGNGYYAFESWHWRFVGIALATELNKKKEYFYDMPQGEINTYRLKMFNKE